MLIDKLRTLKLAEKRRKEEGKHMRHSWESDIKICVIAGASFDSCTSATGIATGSVSLRVMLSGDAVISGGKNVDDTDRKLLFQQLLGPLKPAGEDAANQAAIKVLSSAASEIRLHRCTS